VKRPKCRRVLGIQSGKARLPPNPRILANKRDASVLVVFTNEAGLRHIIEILSKDLTARVALRASDYLCEFLGLIHRAARRKQQKNSRPRGARAKFAVA
jgi:hypothetical protein